MRKNLLCGFSIIVSVALTSSCGVQTSSANNNLPQGDDSLENDYTTIGIVATGLAADEHTCLFDRMDEIDSALGDLHNNPNISVVRYGGCSGSDDGFRFNYQRLFVASTRASGAELRRLVASHEGVQVGDAVLHFYPVSQVRVFEEVRAGTLYEGSDWPIYVLGSETRNSEFNDYGSSLAFSSKFKSLFQNQNVTPFLSYLGEAYGTAIEDKFRTEILPLSNQYEGYLIMSYILESGEEVRATNSVGGEHYCGGFCL